MADVRISQLSRRRLCWTDHMVFRYRSGRRMVKGAPLGLCADPIAFYRRLRFLDRLSARDGSVGRQELSTVGGSQRKHEFVIVRPAAILKCSSASVTHPIDVVNLSVLRHARPY